MKIALFGASGMIGQRILKEALHRGHTVTAIVRDPSRVAGQDGLRAVAGNILDPQGVAAAVAGCDAVVSAFGPGADQDPRTVVDAARALVAGLRASGVRRLVVVGGAGSLEAELGVQVVDTSEFPEAWRPVALAHRDALAVYRTEAEDLDWTYFSPPAFIEPGGRTGQYRLGGDRLLTDAAGQSRISAEDYAVALLDEVEKPRHVRQRFTAAY